MIDRRHLLAAAPSLLFLGGAAPVPADPFEAIERRVGGRLGVFAMDLGNGRSLARRADERFLQASTFKAVLVAMVLHRVEQGRERLDAPVRYDRTALRSNSPVTTAHLGGGLTVAALCAAATAVSDNAAANLLLARCGGPAALTAFVRRLGDRTTRFDRYETDLGERRGPLDTTTPRAIVATWRTLLTGSALSAASRARLDAWLRGNQVGGRRLRAGFPSEWAAADRTGTADGVCNDIACLSPPDGRRLIVAAFHDAPGLDLSRQEDALRDVARTTAQWFS